MIAQCSACGKTFTTESWGNQFCPHCGTQVFLEAPAGDEGGGGGAPPPGDSQQDPGVSAPGGPTGSAGGWEGGRPIGGPGAPGPGAGGYGGAGATGGAGGGYGGGGPTDWSQVPQSWDPPWERRAELGAVKAFFETWKMSIFEPARFFGSQRVDHTKGVLLYGWLAQTISGVASILWMMLIFELLGATVFNSAALQGQDMAEVEQVMQVFRWFVGPVGLAVMPIFAVISIFVWAGLLHLGVMLFGANNRGWNATFRTVNYVSSIQLFNVIPIAFIPYVGSLVGMALSVWSIVLWILGIMYTQRTGGGRATIAVLFWPLACCLLCCIGYIIIFAAMFSGLSGMSEMNQQF